MIFQKLFQSFKIKYSIQYRLFQFRIFQKKTCWRNRAHLGIFCSFGLVALLSLTGCEEQKHPHFPAPLVDAITVHEGDVPITYEYAARIAPFRETEVRARVGGMLLKRYFNEGDFVERGALLFDIEPASYQLAVIKAQAQVAQAQAAYTKAERDAERAQQLVKQNVQSPAFQEQAVFEKLTKAAVLNQAQAALKEAELNLKYTKVTAPISGVTGRDAVSEGSLIGGNSGSNLLTTITQIDPVYVNFSYTDKDAKEIKALRESMAKRGDEVKDLYVSVILGDGTIYPEKGVVDFTSSSLDNLTGTLDVRAILSNKGHRFTPGQFVRVRVMGLKKEHSIAIPETALMQDALGTYVFVIKKLPILKNSSGQSGQQAGTYVAMRRNVRVVSQLANRDWLLEDAKTIIQKSAHAESKDQENTMKQDIIGLQDNDILLVKGHIAVQSGLTAMGGASIHGMPVKISELDGKNFMQETSQKLPLPPIKTPNTSAKQQKISDPNVQQDIKKDSKIEPIMDPLKEKKTDKALQNTKTLPADK